MFTQFEKKIIDIITEENYPKELFEKIAGELYFRAMNRKNEK